jgi:hypothetical protein
MITNNEAAEFRIGILEKVRNICFKWRVGTAISTAIFIILKGYSELENI